MASRIRKKSGSRKSGSRKSNSGDSDNQSIAGDNQSIAGEVEPIDDTLLSTLATETYSLPGLKGSPGTTKKNSPKKKSLFESSSSSPTHFPQHTSNLPGDNTSCSHFLCLGGPHLKCIEKIPLAKKGGISTKPENEKLESEPKQEISKPDFNLIGSLTHWSSNSQNQNKVAVKGSLVDHEERFREQVPSERLKEILSNFSGDKTEEDMFTFFYDMKEKAHLKPKLTLMGKNDKIAQKTLEGRIQCYEERKFKDVLKYLNNAIVQAYHPFTPVGVKGELESLRSKFVPETYSTLATIYAERSAILFARGEFEECLRDINLATMLRPKEEIGENLINRRKLCIRSFSQNSEDDLQNLYGKITYDEYIEKFSQCLLDGKGDKLADLFLIPCKRNSLKEFDGMPSLVSPCRFQPNLTLPCLSQSVGLSYSTIKGRYLLASSAIRPGEVLGSEESYISTLYYPNLITHCYGCLRECSAPMPCPACPWALFCSFDCLIKEIKSNHLKECSSTTALGFMEYGMENLVPTLAFKIMMRLGFSRLKAVLPELRKEESISTPIQKGYKDGLYVNEFRSVYHLTSQKDKLSSDELFRKCSLAYALATILKLSKNFFLDEKGMSFDASRKDFILTGTTLMRILLSLPYNTMEVVGWKVLSECLLQSKSIGAGIFPTLSLVNHSCNPTAEMFYDGKKMNLRALTFIPLGNEITIDYCRSNFKQPLGLRKAALKTFFINCTCEACLFDWEDSSKWCTIKVACIRCEAGVCVERSYVICRVCGLVYVETFRSQKTFWRAVKRVKFAKERFYSTVDKLAKKKKLTEQDFFAITNYLEVLKKDASFPVRDNAYATATLRRIFAEGF